LQTSVYKDTEEAENRLEVSNPSGLPTNEDSLSSTKAYLNQYYKNYGLSSFEDPQIGHSGENSSPFFSEALPPTALGSLG
jgi:hypothetical protein